MTLITDHHAAAKLAHANRQLTKYKHHAKGRANGERPRPKVHPGHSTRGNTTAALPDSGGLTIKSGRLEIAGPKRKFSGSKGLRP